MFCGKCGKEISDDLNFCRFCGAKLSEQKTESGVGENSKRSHLPLILGICVAVLLIAGVILYFAVFSGTARDRADEKSASEEREHSGQRQDDHDADSSSGNGKTGEGENEPAASKEELAEISVTVFAANLDDVITDATVTIEDEAGEAQTRETDGGGVARFEGIRSGDITITAEADGYYSREVQVTASDDISQNMALAPVIVGDDACVLLTWDGNQDLDLCGFNAEIQEYVNCGQISDSINSMILFGDHGSDKGYEMIYVHDLSYEVVKSFYVVEAAAARNGEPSTMEHDGVRIYAYDKNGEQLAMTANSTQTAPLWHPFYIFACGYYEEDEYIIDMVGQSWISFDEDDQVTEREEEQTLTLTTADRDLLGSVALGLGHLCLAEFSDNMRASKTYDRAAMLNLVNGKVPEFVYNVSRNDRFPHQVFELSVDDISIYGPSACRYEYDAAVLQRAVSDILDQNVDFSRTISDSYGNESEGWPFCVYSNGILTCTDQNEYDMDTTMYVGEDVINHELIITYLYGYEYGCDANIVLKVVPADNSLGYCVGAFAYQGLGDVWAPY